MTISVLRTADAWWVQTATGAAESTPRRPPPASCSPTAPPSTRPPQARTPSPSTRLDLVSPVTAPCRVVAQMTNFASHVNDAGHGPEVGSADVLPQGIRLDQRTRSTTSSSPRTSGLLDYEVEIGLVIGRDLAVGTDVTEANLPDYVAGLVVTNDVSARDVQLPQTQFYEAKSYPTFTPVGPALVLLDADELKRFGDLRLQLRVNGEQRQNARRRRRHALPAAPGPAGADPVPAPGRRRPPPDRHAGRHRAQRTAEADRDHRILLPPAIKWKVFFKRQAKNPKYLQRR